MVLWVSNGLMMAFQ